MDVLSMALTVASLAGAVFAWWWSNMSKRAKKDAEGAEQRAEQHLHAAQEHAQAARDSARAAGEQLEHLQSLVAAQEAQGREVQRIAEGLTPERFTVTHRNGVIFTLRNNWVGGCEIERVVNADEFPGLRLGTPLWIDGKRTVEFEYRMYAANRRPAVEIMLALTGEDSPVAVEFPRHKPKN